jgi:hypothetical protein
MATEMIGKKFSNTLYDVNDRENLTQECYGYLKTKLIMGKRILDQQKEIKDLKDSLFKMTTRYTNLLDLFKSKKKILFKIDTQINEKLKKESFNRTKNPNENLLQSPKSTTSKYQSEQGSILNLDCNLNNSIEIIQDNQKEENISLNKENILLKEKVTDLQYEISKISFEKFCLFSDLQELLNSLEMVNLDKLNKFYLSNMNEIKEREKKCISSYMGIKYNILSGLSTISIDSMKSLIERNIRKEGEKENKLEKKKEILDEFNLKEDIIDEKYLKNLKEKVFKYEKELEDYIERNTKTFYSYTA